MNEFEKMLLNSIILAYWKCISTGEWTAELDYLWRTIRFRIYKDRFNKNKITVSSGVALRNITISTKIISWIFQELRSDIINNLDTYKKARN